MIIRLPRGSDPTAGLVPRATPMDPGAVSVDADTPDPGQHRRVGPLSGAKPKQFMFETPTLPNAGHSRPPPRAGTQSVTGRFAYEMLTRPTPGHSRLPPRTETQPGTDVRGPQWADLADTIAQLQFEIDAFRFAPPDPVTSPTWVPPARHGPAAVTTTRVQLGCERC